MVKNVPVMWETQVCSMGQEDPLEKGKAWDEITIRDSSYAPEPVEIIQTGQS